MKGLSKNKHKKYTSDKWFKDILPDKDPYHNRRRDQMRKKGVQNLSACDLPI
jgi:hypothetical protein